MTDVDVSVLLCTYNRAAFLVDVLDRLATLDTGGEFSFEIVVVDNCSEDETKSVILSMTECADVPIRYVFEPRKGVHQARNRSLKEGAGRWFAFIDDDELPETRWLVELYRAARQTGARVLGGAVLLDIDQAVLRSLGREFRTSLRERGSDRVGDEAEPFPKGHFPGTDNLMIDREVIREIGNFDESMIMGGADYDLMIRARNAGHDAWFVPKAVVLHRIPEDRLTTAFMKKDSLQSGGMLAILRHRYHGWWAMVAELVARIGQAALVTLPMMVVAGVTKNGAGLRDRRIKWWRLIGFARYAVLLTCPVLPGNRSFIEKLDFREGRPTATGLKRGVRGHGGRI